MSNVQVDQFVECPKCCKTVSLNRLGGKNMAGEPVMEWHYAFRTWQRCDGSSLSVNACRRKLGMKEGK